MMKKVIACKREMTFSGSYVYRYDLECGHKGYKPCRWNRKVYVPGPPVRAKCSDCAALITATATATTR